jgi:hypothetical protein
MNTLFLSLMLLVSACPCAFANNVPGAQTLSAILMMPLSIVAFSLAGGAYSILQEKKPAGSSVPGWIINVILSAVLIFLSAIPETAFLAILIFTSLAVVRSLKMLSWGADRARNATGFESTSAIRLKVSGAGLFLVSGALASTAMVFLVPWDARYSDHELLLNFMRHQVRYGQQHELRNRPRFDHIEVTRVPADRNVHVFGPIASKFEVTYAPDDESFIVLVKPTRLPSFPFNLITAMPSFRGDESGKVRMCLVHQNEEECPADAPVVHVVDDSEAIQSGQEKSWPQIELELDQSFRRKHLWARGQIGW